MLSTIQLEANVKMEISKIFKDIHGRGPEETSVKIWGNMMIIKLTRSLSPIEESIRLAAGGEELISKIYDILIIDQRESFANIFENILGGKIMDIKHILGKQDSTLYIFSIFKEDATN